MQRETALVEVDSIPARSIEMNFSSLRPTPWVKSSWQPRTHQRPANAAGAPPSPASPADGNPRKRSMSPRQTQLLRFSFDGTNAGAGGLGDGGSAHAPTLPIAASKAALEGGWEAFQDDNEQTSRLAAEAGFGPSSPRGRALSTLVCLPLSCSGAAPAHDSRRNPCVEP
jgi:hypothetical protein